jgi:hypothetical protein
MQDTVGPKGQVVSYAELQRIHPNDIRALLYTRYKCSTPDEATFTRFLSYVTGDVPYTIDRAFHFESIDLVHRRGALLCDESLIGCCALV